MWFRHLVRDSEVAEQYMRSVKPASWTSAHHLTHWIHGGSTDLSNLALLCYRHHWMVHEGRWIIVRGDHDRFMVIPPQMDLFGRLARGPDVGAVA